MTVPEAWGYSKEYASVWAPFVVAGGAYAGIRHTATRAAATKREEAMVALHNGQIETLAGLIALASTFEGLMLKQSIYRQSHDQAKSAGNAEATKRAGLSYEEQVMKLTDLRSEIVKLAESYGSMPGGGDTPPHLGEHIIGWTVLMGSVATMDASSEARAHVWLELRAHLEQFLRKLIQYEEVQRARLLGSKRRPPSPPPYPEFLASLSGPPPPTSS